MRTVQVSPRNLMRRPLLQIESLVRLNPDRRQSNMPNLRGRECPASLPLSQVAPAWSATGIVHRLVTLTRKNGICLWIGKMLASASAPVPCRIRSRKSRQRRRCSRVALWGAGGDPELNQLKLVFRKPPVMLKRNVVGHVFPRWHIPIIDNRFDRVSSFRYIIVR